MTGNIISDQRTVCKTQNFLFSMKTENISQKISKQGVGPGEYIQFEDFTIANDNHIVIADYRKLLYFDPESQFLHETKVEIPPTEGDFSPTEILPTKDNEYLIFLTFPEKHLLAKNKQ